ncbi:DUF1302 domain-containing protein [Paraneptunicella aestuarii]|uniref:DUF1302 domain-containing protein n=1 Tax=Paraneptunicella aestuarii TaxID=2831148 RepID=UPI001E57618D|nr:DUF1302 domain-containing protein [Paraneptunicella aestuarii]UAA37151.1 DUF1302 domain-containing protein [Paraneptunicella aestuarii]
MKIGSRIIKMSPLALSMAAALSATAPAHAVEWSSGDLKVSFDSTFSLGIGIRAEERDYDKIGKSNLANLDWTGYNMASNIIYSGEDIWAINSDTGAYSSNADNGNLNYDKGDLFSLQFKGVHELNLSYKNVGAFVRGMYFYDFEMADSDRAWTNYLSGQLPGGDTPNDPCSDPDADDNLCKDIRFLDAFVYADFDIGEMPVTVRVGDQVISWGESTFIQHGINNINPVDVARATAPGAELKEVFIPVGTIFASIGVTDTIGLEMYYQYEWDRSVLPVSGSYLSTNDWAGDGGYLNNIQLAFTRNPDIDSAFLTASLNALGDNIRAGLDPVSAGAALLAHATKVGLRPYGDAFYNDADDQGQYGVKLSYISEDLNDTEFGFYYMNYHAKRPVFSGIAANYTASGLAQGVSYLANNTITEQNITDIAAFPQAQAYFPEDIKLYGLSFNTNVGETSLAGEIAFRQDEPLQIDDVETLYAAFPEQLAAAGLRPDLAGISQYDNWVGHAPEPGEFIQGYITSDTVQAQATITHLFGPTMGTDNLIFLAEVGYVEISDMPDPDVLRLEVPGTYRSGPIQPLTDADGNIISTREGLHQGLSNGPDTDGHFATDSAWGYRLLGVADFNNVFSGINLQVRGTFAHDVDGYTPNPMFLFFEGRKSSSISFTFDYLSKLSATASYNSFWGGGTANGLSDRDFISFNIKYSI